VATIQSVAIKHKTNNQPVGASCVANRETEAKKQGEGMQRVLLLKKQQAQQCLLS